VVLIVYVPYFFLIWLIKASISGWGPCALQLILNYFTVMSTDQVEGLFWSEEEGFLHHNLESSWWWLKIGHWRSSHEYQPMDVSMRRLRIWLEILFSKIARVKRSSCLLPSRRCRRLLAGGASIYDAAIFWYYIMIYVASVGRMLEGIFSLQSIFRSLHFAPRSNSSESQTGNSLKFSPPR